MPSRSPTICDSTKSQTEGRQASSACLRSFASLLSTFYLLLPCPSLSYLLLSALVGPHLHHLFSLIFIFPHGSSRSLFLPPYPRRAQQTYSGEVAHSVVEAGKLLPYPLLPILTLSPSPSITLPINASHSPLSQNLIANAPKLSPSEWTPSRLAASSNIPPFLLRSWPPLCPQYSASCLHLLNKSPLILPHVFPLHLAISGPPPRPPCTSYHIPSILFLLIRPIIAGIDLDLCHLTLSDPYPAGLLWFPSRPPPLPSIAAPHLPVLPCYAAYSIHLHPPPHLYPSIKLPRSIRRNLQTPHRKLDNRFPIWLPASVLLSLPLLFHAFFCSLFNPTYRASHFPSPPHLPSLPLPPLPHLPSHFPSPPPTFSLLQ
ncbi:hypothetical protein C7M84_012672 [Penaeus vannamei]|uniref:Uncharacterized protein n=1 Tax=Penaeus vannamei TaxID=6689 RepID=A0A423SY58_PENVA|nr:hypothetical protein C7M84_012672 [Penaeus vannamei]